MDTSGAGSDTSGRARSNGQKIGVAGSLEDPGDSRELASGPVQQREAIASHVKRVERATTADTSLLRGKHQSREFGTGGKQFLDRVSEVVVALLAGRRVGPRLERR
jgi:hypothetical protein